ncbi:hypothetical protein [Microcoleus sp. Pol7_B1]
MFFQIPETDVLEFNRANSELNAHSPLLVRVLTAKIVETKVTPEDGIFP